MLRALLIACLLSLFSLQAFAASETDEEIEMGKTSAAEVTKQSKFIQDPALVKRVETIGNVIAKLAKEKEIPATYGKSKIAKFEYTFKIVDDPEVNAFALPAGYIYVNKGLLDYVQSDDELAGVLAHEVSHVAHHHLMQLIKAQQKENTALALAVLMGVAAGAKGDSLQSIAYALTLIRIAKMSGYSQNAEYDADRTAVCYLAETKYNPVGVLTSMERLARDEARKPQRDYGMFMDHPSSNARAKVIISEIEKRGLPINRRLVTTYVRVQVKPVPDSTASSVCIGDTEIIRLAEEGAEKSSVRAERVASKLTDAMIAGAQMNEVKVNTSGQCVTIKGNTIVAPSAADAALAGKTIPELIASTANAIRKALLSERLNEQY